MHTYISKLAMQTYYLIPLADPQIYIYIYTYIYIYVYIHPGTYMYIYIYVVTLSILLSRIALACSDVQFPDLGTDSGSHAPDPVSRYVPLPLPRAVQAAMYGGCSADCDPQSWMHRGYVQEHASDV